MLKALEALKAPSHSAALVVGGGTMGADVALVLARAGCKVIVLESAEPRRKRLQDYFVRGMTDLGVVDGIDPPSFSVLCCHECILYNFLIISIL